MAVSQKPLTADEYYHHPDGQKPGELVRGVMRVMSPTGGAHGAVVANILIALSQFVRANRLGRVFADNTGFALAIPGADADTVRSPDIAFIRAALVPPDGIPLRGGFLRVTPDLVAEVLSPDQTLAEIDERRADFFAAGTRVMWVVNPRRRTVAVHAPSAPPRFLGEFDTLDGGDVLPGLAIPVAVVFEDIARD